jgi:hypothetical protein
MLAVVVGGEGGRDYAETVVNKKKNKIKKKKRKFDPTQSW